MFVCFCLTWKRRKTKEKTKKYGGAKKKKIAKKHIFVVFGQQKKILTFLLCCGVEFFEVWDVFLVLLDMENQENKRKNVKKGKQKNKQKKKNRKNLFFDMFSSFLRHQNFFFEFFCFAVEFFGLLKLFMHLFEKKSLENERKKEKKWIQHHTVPGWSPTPVLSGLKPR